MLEINPHGPWNSWSHRATFPRVRANFERDDVFRILRLSSRRAGHSVAEWVGPWPWSPRLLQEDSYEELADLIDGGLPAAAWQILASAWVKR
jgi:hypothetical protein